MAKRPNYYLFLLGLALILIVLLYPKQVEPFQSNPSTVICLMCVCPTESVVRFAEQLSPIYKVYIVCDDPSCSTPDSSAITYLKITDNECIAAGYNRSNPAIPKIPSAWDKALYYFCVKDTTPQHVWFIEEDVFVPRPTLLSDIDAKYPTTDLIAKQNVEKTEDPAFMWWHEADGVFNPPIYRSLVCASRLSRKLLIKIDEFVQKNNRLVFIEILFNTIVHHEKMTLAMPEQLSTIIWRHDWTHETVDEEHMFHPVKNVALHDSYRERLSQIAAREN